MIQVPWRSARPCRATVDWPDPHPFDDTLPFDPPSTPLDMVNKVVQWAITPHSDKNILGPIEQFVQSKLTCKVDKQHARILNRASSMSDFIILNGDRGLSASATGVMVGKMGVKMSGGRLKTLDKWVYIAKSLDEAMRVEVLLREVFPGLLISTCVPGTESDQNFWSTVHNSSPLVGNTEGIIVLPDLARELMQNGFIGSFIIEDDGSIFKTRDMASFMHYATLEMRSISIDNRVYKATERTVGRVIILAGMDKDTVDYWTTRATILEKHGLMVAHWMSNSPMIDDDRRKPFSSWKVFKKDDNGDSHVKKVKSMCKKKAVSSNCDNALDDIQNGIARMGIDSLKTHEKRTKKVARMTVWGPPLKQEARLAAKLAVKRAPKKILTDSNVATTSN